MNIFNRPFSNGFYHKVDGIPYTTTAELSATQINMFAARARRSILLKETDWAIVRHQEETLKQVQTTLSAQEFSDLTAYRQALRDITETYDGSSAPETITWPTPPAFLTPSN